MKHKIIYYKRALRTTQAENGHSLAAQILKR